MLRIEAALTGNLKEVLEEERKEAAWAITAGTHKAGNDLKLRLRAMVVSAFGSQRLANSWRGVSFPGAGKVSLGPTDLVYSKAPHIIEAFSATTTIRGRNGFWLAIPSPEVMAMRFGNNSRPTPDQVERRLGIKLVFVYRPGKASLLIANQVRRHTGKRKGFAKASAASIKKGTSESVVMFFLVPQVTLKKMFDLEAEYERAGVEMLNNIFAAWETK